MSAAKQNARLVAIREQLGLTQTEMANLLGVHMRTYQQWELIRRLPGAAARTLIDKVAVEHGVKLNRLPAHLERE